MKTLQAVLFFALLGVSLCAKFTEDFLTASDKECIKELGLEIQTVLDSVDDNFLSVEGDAKINDFTECAYRKQNAINENNEINLDVVKPLMAGYMEYIDNDLAGKEQLSNDAVDFCNKNVEGNSVGDRLIKFGNCFVNKVQQH